MDSRTGQVTGKLSGSTVTGTKKIRTQAPDGTVKISEGPMSWQTTRSGDCAGSDSRTNPATEGTATWSPLK